MVAGLAFKTSDGAKWGGGNGSGTGGNLTPAQADENTWTLHQRILALENDPPTAISIAGFTVIGSQMQVNLTNGDVDGPFPLPIATLRLVGEWVNSMPLAVLDVFTVAHDGVYITNVAHTTPASPTAFDPDADDGSGNPLYTKMFGDDAYIYDFGFFYPGQPGLGIADGAAIAGHVVVRPILLPAGLDGSKGDLLTPPAANLSFPVQVNGVVKGSMDFASGDNAATFTWAADVSMAAGDVVKLMKPTAIDSAAYELSCTFLATRLFDT
jgi:hypothetical protein